MMIKIIIIIIISTTLISIGSYIINYYNELNSFRNYRYDIYKHLDGSYYMTTSFETMNNKKIDAKGSIIRKDDYILPIDKLDNLQKCIDYIGDHVEQQLDKEYKEYKEYIEETDSYNNDEIFTREDFGTDYEIYFNNNLIIT